MNWSRLCAPKVEGGLQVQNFDVRLEAQHAALVERMIKFPDIPWVKAWLAQIKRAIPRSHYIHTNWTYVAPFALIKKITNPFLKQALCAWYKVFPNGRSLNRASLSQRELYKKLLPPLQLTEQQKRWTHLCQWNLSRFVATTNSLTTRNMVSSVVWRYGTRTLPFSHTDEWCPHCDHIESTTHCFDSCQEVEKIVKVSQELWKELHPSLPLCTYSLAKNHEVWSRTKTLKNLDCGSKLSCKRHVGYLASPQW